MFKIQVQPFFDQEYRQWEFSALVVAAVFFSNAFLTAAGLVPQFMVERWSFERELVGSTPVVGPNLGTMFTKTVRFPTSFSAHLVCRLVLKTNELRRNSSGNFQWTKTLYQNNLNNIACFFTFFKGYRYN